MHPNLRLPLRSPLRAVGARRGSGGGGEGGVTANTWNPSESQNGTLSLSNKRVTFTNAGAVRALTGGSGETKIWRLTCTTILDSGNYIGMSRQDISHTSSSGAVLMRQDGTKFTGGSTGASAGLGTAVSYTTGDVFDIELRGTSLYMKKNGEYFGGQDPDTDTNPLWTGLTASATWKPYVFNGDPVANVFTLE